MTGYDVEVMTNRMQCQTRLNIAEVRIKLDESQDNVKLQKQRRMEKNLLSQFASQFAEASLTSLVESFNAQVGNRGFNSARAAHDHALIDELVRRGVDVSAISDGHSISFAHHIAIDETNMKLVIQG